jgi:transcription antitermination factor NusB
VKIEPRAEALGILYAADSRSLDAPDTSGATERVTDLANGVWDNREAIDAAIEDASTSWRMDRMAVVDRNILRLGTFELMFSDLSVAIVISEAVELAKGYSTSGSGGFINGVLSGVASAHRADDDGES